MLDAEDFVGFHKSAPLLFSKYSRVETCIFQRRKVSRRNHATLRLALSRRLKLRLETDISLNKTEPK